MPAVTSVARDLAAQRSSIGSCAGWYGDPVDNVTTSASVADFLVHGANG